MANAHNDYGATIDCRDAEVTRHIANRSIGQVRMRRAGQAHPGVWLVLGLVGMLYVDQTPLSDGLKSVVRVTLLLAPILVSLGFFLSVLSPKAERPNGLINLIYLAALLLAVGVVTLGIGLFQA